MRCWPGGSENLSLSIPYVSRLASYESWIEAGFLDPNEYVASFDLKRVNQQCRRMLRLR